VRNQDKGGVGADYAVGKTDMLELQNGCVCCSASDELFVNIRRLIEAGFDEGILSLCRPISLLYGESL
jgi:G3E family GTPase